MILTALFMAAAVQAAPRDQISFDIRCMVAAQQVMEHIDGAEKTAVGMASMYYFGRVDSALTGANLEQRLEAESKSLIGQPLGPLLAECGEYMTERGKALMAIGEAIEKKERAAAID